MNERIYIENAKVLKKGQFATGNGDKGPWAAIHLKVEWEYTYTDESNQPQTGKMSAVVKLSGDQAAWARDNVTEGNPWSGQPFTFLNLWVRMFGEIKTMPRSSGQGTWENTSNTLVAEFVQIVQPQAPGQQPQA